MRIWLRIRSFFFPQENDDWLSILRIGLGLQMVAYCIALRAAWAPLLSRGGHGLVGREVSEAYSSVQSPWLPKIGWIVAAAEKFGIGEQSALFLVWLVLLAGALFLILGFLSRPAAVVCWFLHLCATKSGGLASYGIDNFMTIGLFYLMLSPLPDRWALNARIWRRNDPDFFQRGFFRRVLQLHLCLIYFFGGLTKALGSGWWNGDNLWRALTRPPFDILPPEMVATWQPFLPALGLGIWLIELSYPFLIWPQRTRLLWLSLTCLMHFGIGFAMGMHLFALVMIVLNVAAFGPRPASAQPSS